MCELFGTAACRPKTHTRTRKKPKPLSNARPSLPHSKHKRNQTHRPRCVERKPNRIDEAQRLRTLRRQIDAVVAQHRRPDVAERALGAHLDFRLVVCHADAEFRVARSDAVAAVVRDAAAAFAHVVLALVVAKVLQPQLEQAGGADLNDGDTRTVAQRLAPESSRMCRGINYYAIIF